jgi:DNA polymerase III alpha subunit (gram-positive type)
MIIVDIETTGVDSKKHAIIDIGAVDFSNPKNTFSIKCRMFDGAKVEKEALVINGYTIHEINTHNYSQKEALELFQNWILNIKEDRTFCAHNTSFDYSFIEEAFRRVNLEFPFSKRVLDLHGTMYNKYLELGLKIPLNNKQCSNLSSNVLAKFVGIPEEPNEHKGINGAKWEAEAYSRIIFGKYLFEEFVKYEIPHYLEKK